MIELLSEASSLKEAAINNILKDLPKYRAGLIKAYNGDNKTFTSEVSNVIKYLNDSGLLNAIGSDPALGPNVVASLNINRFQATDDAITKKYAQLIGSQAELQKALGSKVNDPAWQEVYMILKDNEEKFKNG